MRAGFWRFLSGPYGKGPTPGLEQKVMDKPLALGICTHKGFEKLVTGSSGEVAAEAALAEAAKYESLGVIEKQWLLGICLAWERSKQEEFLNQYDVLGVEKEIETSLSPNVILQSRADAIVQDRNDGTIWVINWKTTSHDLKEFNKQWRFDVQSWYEALAVEGSLGMPVAGTIYYGIYKGPVWNGQMTSRLIYGYKEETLGGNTVYTPEYKAGLKRFPVWEETFPFGEGVAAWVSWLPKEFLAKHFASSPPVMRNDKLVEKYLRQVIRKEGDIDHILATGSTEDIEDFFEQRWGEWCEKCPFLNLCAERSSPETLIAEGILKPRRDHHLKEEEEE
jgi:hypothetical protein